MALKYWRGRFPAGSTAPDPPGGEKGQLPGRPARRGPAGREEGPVQVARSQLGQLGRQLDGGRVGVGPDREVGELGRLLAGGLGQLGPAVADLHREQPGEAVEVALAVLVPDVAALAPLDDLDLFAGPTARDEGGEVAPEVGGGE